MFSVLPTPMHNSEGQNVPNYRVQDCSLSMLGQVLWGWLFTLSLVVCGLDTRDTAPAYGGNLATVSS